MVLTRRSEKIEEVIARGGEVKRSPKQSKNFKVLCQKIRLDILDLVDKAVAERAGMNRNAWIQEAIQEKLKRIKDAN